MYPSMESLISVNFLPLSPTLFPQSLSPLYFRSLPKSPTFLYSFHRKSLRKRKHMTISCSFSASPDPIPSNYGGWDDPELLRDPKCSGKLDPFRNFLISVGIDDRKYAFLFFLGFLSALAVSRVRFSFMVILPVSVLVFVFGFSAGVAQSGIGRNGGNFRVSDEKFSDLEAFLNDLKNGLEGGTDLSLNHLDMSKIKNCLEVIETVKKTVEGSMAGKFLDGNLGFDSEGEKKSNPKVSRKRKELGVTGFDFVQFLGGLFQENVIGVKAPEAKDTSKGEVIEQLNSVGKDNPVIVGSVKESVAGNEIEDRGSNPLIGSDQENSKIEESELLFNKNIEKFEGNAPEKVKAIKTVLNNDDSVRSTAVGMNGKKSYRSKGGSYGKDMLLYDEELNILNRSLRFMSKQESFQKMVFKHNYEGRLLQSDTRESADCINDQRTARNMDFFTAESEASSLLEQTLKISNKSYNSSHRSTSSKQIEEMTVKSEDQNILGNQQPLHVEEEGNMPPSSTISVDEEFNQYMKEAMDLLKQAKEYMTSQGDEETADTILYKSAKLLSAAVAMRPMSLLAVGQLGNTYLLHGELKLKISRELRTLLLRSDALLNGKGRGVRFKKLETHVLSREEVASVLVEVCEECEDLLVKAGRKYKMALSIDGNDVRALYNWGLALSFRAQLIADIGPEAAFDADKVYLAAIDKFDAMMSRSNLYATHALYRWGIALQQRSHLRPRNNREKMKLLQQAKSLFEDVLSVESDNQQVREALVSCVSELNYIG